MVAHGCGRVLEIGERNAASKTMIGMIGFGRLLFGYHVSLRK
jgi:hypothetical protein